MQIESLRCQHVIVKQSIPIRGLIWAKYRKGQIWEIRLIRM